MRRNVLLTAFDAVQRRTWVAGKSTPGSTTLCMQDRDASVKVYKSATKVKRKGDTATTDSTTDDARSDEKSDHFFFSTQ
jgi:hypothetical protein